MPGLIRLFLIIAISLMLHACGGGSAETPWDTTTDTSGDGSGDGTGDNTTDPDYFLGSGTGAGFTAGVLNIDVTSLSAGGSTTVSANIADADGALLLESTNVAFTSTCVAGNLASITSPITTDTGVATTVYSAEGCSGTDTITATATLNSVVRSATGTLTVQPAVIGSMQFVSAAPSIIGIKGFGLNEVAEVIFQVLDTNGNPVQNQVVNFALSTTVGGVNLPNSSDTSDANGLVRADVQSGTVPTTVRVTATLASNPTISTQSDGLTVSTGIADQNSISLSLSDKNPEAWAIDGQTVSVTVYAADHFNNPVPNGTAVTFNTEGGQIQSQCLTSGGSCSVNWTSSNPRPSLGRVTVLATMLGEETFIDANGNGVLDNNDTFSDEPEAYRDDDESGSFDLGSEEFLDFNSSGVYDLADGEYNGVLCCDATAVASAVSGDACFGKTAAATVTCSTSKNIHVRGSGVIVMAASDLTLYAPVSILNGGGQSVDSTTVYVFHDIDGNGVPSAGDQVPPSGTRISISTTNGSLESAGSITVPSTNFNGVYSTNIRWRGDTTSSAGSMSISATTPSGRVTSGLYIDLVD